MATVCKLFSLPLTVLRARTDFVFVPIHQANLLGRPSICYAPKWWVFSHNKQDTITPVGSLVWFVHACKRCFKRLVSRLCSRAMMLLVILVPDFLHPVTPKAQVRPQIRTQMLHGLGHVCMDQVMCRAFISDWIQRIFAGLTFMLRLEMQHAWWDESSRVSH